MHLLWRTLTLTFMILTAGWFFAPTAHAASCADGTLSGRIESDTTISGMQYMDGDVTVRNGATLTVTPGTTITVCGEHLLWVQDATLVAEGTADEPIQMTPEGEGDSWRGILIESGTVRESLLRHVEVIRGGKHDDNTELGAIHIYASSGTVGKGPTLDHVTVRDSGAYGIYVRVDDDDDTPLTLSNLTVEGSASAPLMIYSSAMLGLGEGNSFSNNADNVIELRGDVVLGGRIYYSQTWPRQPVPFYVPSGNSIRIGHADNLPVVTVAAGNEFRMGTGAFFNISHGSLVVEGTADAPVRMTSTSDATYWRGINIGGGGVVVQPSSFRYLEVIRGGEDDDSTDLGAIDIYAPDGTAGGGPVLDHVTVRDSAAYGIHVRVRGDDGTPLSLTNLTVDGSASAPLMIYASAMIGLGTGNSFSDNGHNVIELRGGESLGGEIYFSQTWPRQPVPFYLPPGDAIRITSEANQPVVTVAPGNIFEMDDDAFVWVTRGGLVAEGTADQPIIFRRAGNEPWRGFLIDQRFSPSQSRLAYVEISGTDSEEGAVEISDGEFSISHADIRNNAGPGVHISDGFLRITDSTLTANRIGAEFVVGSGGILRNNNLAGNVDGGVINDDSRGYCVDAINNFWGSGAGPNDPSADADDCGQTTTNSGGTPVSDNVRYVPWQASLDGGDVADATLITPDPYWAIADGVATVQLDVLVRDATGAPLVGKVIELATTHGDLTQPTAPTDSNGRTVASIRADAEGNALITARNVTDDEPLSAIASVYFWQGPGDAGGLIDPSGVPYAAPEFIVEGEPYQAGIPLIFRLPMQNTNSTPVDVSVTYAATDLGIGQRFTPVATAVTRTLAPGERWEAEATWAPTETGHQCVQATLTYDLPDGQVVVQQFLTGGTTTRQRNLTNKPPDDPCDEPDATKLIPTKGGIGGVNKHFKNATEQTIKVDKCLQTLSFAAQAAGTAQDEREYEVVATPPVFTPPTQAAGPEVTQAQADAANALADVAAEVAGLRVAIGLTIERAQWAGQADDVAALRLQLQAYQDYRAQLRVKLLAYADAIDAVLAATRDAGEPDISMTTADYAAYLDELKTSGYDAETLDYYQTSGLDAGAIASMLQEEIAVLEEQLPPPTTFYALLVENRDAARAEAGDLPDAVQAAVDGLLRVDEEPSSSEFVVSNPTDARATVDLVVRPVALPVGWSYELDKRAPVLEAGESTTVTLTLYPSGSLVEGVVPQVAVEGFIGNEYIGGVLIRAGLPVASAVDGPLYLPLLQSD